MTRAASRIPALERMSAPARDRGRISLRTKLHSRSKRAISVSRPASCASVAGGAGRVAASDPATMPPMREGIGVEDALDRLLADPGQSRALNQPVHAAQAVDRLG